MLRFSANIGFLWPDLPLLARIAAARQAGFRAVEMHWPYDVPAEAIAACAEAAGIRVTGLNTHVGKAGEFGLGAVPGREAEFEVQIAEALAYCRLTGATMIHAMAGVTPADARARSTFAANLRRAAAEAERQGVTLLLEPINQRDRPGYFYSRVEDAADMIDKVAAGNIRLLFDVYHVAIASGDVLHRLERFFPLVGHVQIAAVPSRAEPDEGEIAYRAIFAALESLGYAGFIGCEYKPRGETAEGLVWTERLGIHL